MHGNIYIHSHGGGLASVALRDRSLITGKEGGLQNGKTASINLFTQPSQGRVKLFALPLQHG